MESKFHCVHAVTQSSANKRTHSFGDKLGFNLKSKTTMHCVNDGRW